MGRQISRHFRRERRWQNYKLYDNTSTALYVTADDLWFTIHKLVELADMFYKNGGRTLYIDEIHRYHNWSIELKNIYDTYGLQQWKLEMYESH